MKLPQIKCWREANDFLGSKDRRKLANNTYLIRLSDQAIAVRYYETNIVTYFLGSTVELTYGNFPTKSTHLRIEQFTNFVIKSQNEEWVLVTPRYTGFWETNCCLVYSNGEVKWLLNN